MTILGSLTTEQRLTLAERLVSLIDAKEDRFFLPAMHIKAEQERPLLAELEKAGFIFWDRAQHRVHRGPELEKPPEVASYEARRDKMLRASPVGRRILGIDTGTAPNARAGGLSPERRAALLGASGLGRGMLKSEDGKKTAK